MKKVTEHLLHLILKQVEDHSLVVWYDPESHYTDTLAELSARLQPSGGRLVCYHDSFFALRAEIEPLLGDVNPPSLVVYMPMDQTGAQDALIEVEAAGVTMKPGQQPPARNTRLSLLARDALRPVLGDATAAAIEKQTEVGKLTLSDLDKLGEKSGALARGTVTLVFGTDNPSEIALSFLSSDRFDAELVSKDALSELTTLLQSAFEVEPADSSTPETYRAQLARHILSTDLISGLWGQIPSRLSSLKIATSPVQRQSCVSLARTWRLRRDLRECYVEHASRIEKELGLADLNLGREQIAEVETCLVIEVALQRDVESALLEEPTEDLLSTARTRQSGFWSEQRPEIQARWALIAAAGQVILEADHVQREVKSSSAAKAQALFRGYAEGDRPWCLLDTFHRRLEQRCHGFDFDLNGQHGGLEKLIARARQRYADAGSLLAERFVRGYQAAHFHPSGVLRQNDVYATRVKPQLEERKTAYVWVDALRFEMARELAGTLESDYEVEVQAALGTFPTITEIGMAALLPGAQEASGVLDLGNGRLALQIDGTALKDRKDRVSFMKSHAGVEVFEARLQDLFPSPKKKVRDGVKGAELVLITSQEIDTLCEEDNVHLARGAMDEILRDLGRAFRTLRDLGVETIVVSADHGYLLLSEELGSEMLIDAPGGDTIDLHRRVWLGHGGTANPAFLRARLADFGLNSDLEIATPWGFACFKVAGGAMAYFHGGLSPQELIVPVLTLSPRKKLPTGATSKVDWSLTLGSQSISTRFVSVQIAGQASQLLEFVPPRVRVEIRAGGECVSRPVSASYGLVEATGDVQLRPAPEDAKGIEPNTVALMIVKELPRKAAVSIHLLDAGDVELARLENVATDIAI